MIKRVPGGYQVFSESGKPLSKPGLRRAQAEQRLKQVEYFKNKALGGAVEDDNEGASEEKSSPDRVSKPKGR